MGAVLEGFLLVYLFTERLLKRVWHDLRRVYSQDEQMGDVESYVGSHMDVARSAVFPHRSIRTGGVSKQNNCTWVMWRCGGVAACEACPHRCSRTSSVPTQIYSDERRIHTEKGYMGDVEICGRMSGVSTLM